MSIDINNHLSEDDIVEYIKSPQTGRYRIFTTEKLKTFQSPKLERKQVKTENLLLEPEFHHIN